MDESYLTTWGRVSFVSSILILPLTRVNISFISQSDVMSASAIFLAIGIVSWMFTSDEYPVPFVIWLFGRIPNDLSNVSTMQLYNYHWWLQQKSTNRISIFNKYSSTEIVSALEECESELRKREEAKGYEINWQT